MKRKMLFLSLSAVILVITFSSITNADTFKKSRVEGIYNAWYDSSVSSYGYTGAIDAARKNWSDISSNVSIGYTNDKTGYSTDEVYVGTTAQADLLGRALPHVISWPINIPVDPDMFNWDYSVVSFYHNNFVSHNLNTFNLRKHIATHEFGHALGLAHTTGANQYNSIMKSGTNEEETIFSPTSYDKGQLRDKWGN
ncbi:matrixin family metalloprotease [Paenibacillus thiaminolyticus]|uniref:Peptidase M10 metallopeptidase domain-containing protein n=1 Tax=Paenibacillus thiaminolyticus TaxID=49283 RepID=A0A3A3GIT0_PANTH|nr:matrixin family metalloprotease [Paenibacillus thiaminolyticus]RJG23080.1 hypothetical protein DQX05_14480 [Paenibacillus thiaminolyticus]